MAAYRRMSPFFDPSVTPNGGLSAAATQRNREPILEVLRRVLPTQGLVLEIASGTGQHAAYFSSAFPALSWQPSDVLEAHLKSIEAWRQAAGAPNLLSPVALDVEVEPWPIVTAAAILNINMIHIAPCTIFEGERDFV